MAKYSLSNSEERVFRSFYNKIGNNRVLREEPQNRRADW